MIDLEEYRQRRVARSERPLGDDKERSSLQPAGVPVALWWYPMWTWMPMWQVR
ncbi:hypothetical protein [Sorangium sp. So ce131]|uniref:hypothetical protein n=1 Tax=Sorangium sp. So ce131 TaxID=3133282 RepID=UPI003F5F095C